MSKAIQCEMYPKVNGEESILYKDLLKRIKDRPLTNFIYAAYLQQGVAAQITNKGYSVNKQGQHDASAVYDFFDVVSLQNEISSIRDMAVRMGARDTNGNLVNLTDAKDALQKAEQANQNSKGTVSYVVRRNDVFNIITEEKNSRTQIRAHEVKKKLAIWNALEQIFSSKGIDLNTFDFNRTLVNANNGKNFIEWASSLSQLRNDLLSQKEIRTILEFDKNSTQVQRIERMFGNLDNAAAEMYNAFHGGMSNYTQGQISLMNDAINTSKKIQGLDIQSAKQQVLQIEGSLNANSQEVNIQTTLEDLDKKYHIDINEINRNLGDTIKSLRDAAAEAAVTLQRQLKKLKAEQGLTPDVQRLERTINQLLKELENKKYYSGAMGFLAEALNQVNVMEQLLKDAYQATGTTFEQAKKRASAIMEIKDIKEGFYHIVDALSRPNNLIIDESINNADIQAIETQAKAVKDFFDNYEQKLRDIREDTMVDIAREYLGDSLPTGIAIVNIVKMAEADSSIYDHFYSVGRVSNPLIATMGTIIRDAQGRRNKKLRDIAIRIRRENYKLNKAGIKNTRFIYEENSNYIVSDIDWPAYKKAKNIAKTRFKKRGLKGFALEQAIEQWEDANTEDRVVDYVSGRTERVPNSNYRKHFSFENKAMQEYYNNMMQIKGEIGTMLPKYAQKHYLPPQIRRKFWDAVFESKGNPKKILKAIGNTIKDKFIIREDDELNSANGIIEGEEYGIRSGALDNTPYRQIPIFFVNRLKDQGELLKDFSSGLQHLASTAINYECINEIKDVVEMMGDFIKNQEIPPKGKKLVEKVQNTAVVIFKHLRGHAKATNTEHIVDSFINQHIYGTKLEHVNKLSKAIVSFIGYNSMKALSTNVKGYINNYLMGELQMLIEAGAGEFYNSWDWAWANAKVFGLTGDIKTKAGNIMDYFSNNVNSEAVLLAQMFDPLSEQFHKLAAQRYFSNPLRRMMPDDFMFIGYGLGENLIHFVTMYAVLHHEKVMVNGKKVSLYNALYIGNKEDGNSELLVKPNAKYKNKDGKWVDIDQAYLDSIRDRIRYCNQTTHGSMNDEDKGVIHQKLYGRAIMNLRQWMVEHYSRRFRGKHWEDSLKEWREGYYYTTGRLLWSYCRALLRFESEYATQWSQMNSMQKANVKRAMREQFIMMLLLGLSFAIGETDELKEDAYTRFWAYQAKRALMEVKASTPEFISFELMKLLNSPIPATSTINGLLYIVFGIPDMAETIQRGRYAGWNKYWRNVLKYSLPFWRHIDELIHMNENDDMFAIFDKTSM